MRCVCGRVPAKKEYGIRWRSMRSRALQLQFASIDSRSKLFYNSFWTRVQRAYTGFISICITIRFLLLDFCFIQFLVRFRFSLFWFCWGGLFVCLLQCMLCRVDDAWHCAVDVLWIDRWEEKKAAKCGPVWDTSARANTNTTWMKRQNGILVSCARTSYILLLFTYWISPSHLSISSSGTKPTEYCIHLPFFISSLCRRTTLSKPVWICHRHFLAKVSHRMKVQTFSTRHNAIEFKESEAKKENGQQPQTIFLSWSSPIKTWIPFPSCSTPLLKCCKLHWHSSHVHVCAFECVRTPRAVKYAKSFKASEALYLYNTPLLYTYEPTYRRQSHNCIFNRK